VEATEMTQEEHDEAMRVMAANRKKAKSEK